MSKPVEPRPSGPVPATKERLDELDALLERMLSLPVNQLVEPEVVPRRSAAVLPPPAEDGGEQEPAEESAAIGTQAFLPKPRAYDPEPEPAAVEEPLIKVAVIDTTDGAKSVPPETLFAEPETPAAPNPFVFSTHDEPVSTAESSSQQVIEVSATPAGAGESPDLVPEKTTAGLTLPVSEGKTGGGRSAAFVLLRPLVWSNRAFDACAARFGPPGRWLSGPAGRSALGWTGLALLSAALVWGVLDWMGWTW